MGVGLGVVVVLVEGLKLNHRYSFSFLFLVEGGPNGADSSLTFFSFGESSHRTYNIQTPPVSKRLVTSSTSYHQKQQYVF